MLGRGRGASLRCTGQVTGAIPWRWAMRGRFRPVLASVVPAELTLLDWV